MSFQGVCKLRDRRVPAQLEHLHVRIDDQPLREGSRMGTARGGSGSSCIRRR